MKQIKLTKNKVALVDNDDFETLNRYRWYAVKLGNTFYAMRKTYTPPKTVYMHREILNLKSGDKRETDHINHDGLNNQRSNLRICNRRQNNFNHRMGWGISMYKGVSLYKNTSTWRAYIQDNGKPRHLGCFNNEVDAALAYNAEAKRLYGNFVRLNNVA